MIKKITLILFMATTMFGQVFTDNSFGSASSAGTAGSQNSVISGVWSYAINPAGLTAIKEYEIGVNTFKPSGQSFYSYSSFSAAMNLGEKWGTVNVHGDQSSVDYADRQFGNETNIGLSHAFFLQNDLRSSLQFGYSVNYMSVDFGQSAGLSGNGSDGIDLGSGSVIGVDVGVQASLRNRSWVGVSIKNINSPEMGNSKTFQLLPQKLTVGMGYSPYYGLVTTFAVDKLLGNEFQYKAGVEYNVFDWMTLRSGISTYPSQLTLGAGFHWKMIAFDYAYISHPVLPPTQMFTLNLLTFN